MFSIQIGNPRVLRGTSICEAENLCEAIEDTFPHETEDAYLNWNGVRVAINYKYDFSVMASDVVAMLDAILSKPQGEHVASWASSSFRGTWRVRWSEHELVIHPIWEAVTGNIESILASAGDVEIPTMDFVAEWLELLELVARHLETLGVRPDVAGWPELRRLLEAASVAGRGSLYREVP